MATKKLSGWNNRPVVVASVEDYRAQDTSLTAKAIRGNGRSYGDASLNDQIVSTLCHREKRIIENGVLTISSGFLLKEVLEMCIQHQYFFPVIPGTQWVTVGGMVAADVHGKNHRSHGTIGRWINWLTIQLTTGELKHCSPTEETDLFQATIGGMGLTGIIVEVQFKLEPLNGTHLTQQTTKYQQFSALRKALEHSSAAFSVGWIDFLNNDQLLLLEADFLTSSLPASDQYAMKKPRINIPTTGIRFVYPWLMKWYNKRYQKRMLRNKTVSISNYFFPLDNIGHWNRLYGKKGLIQYQCVIPISAAKALEQIIERIRTSAFQPMLAVMKYHGSLPSPGWLSFPVEGFSLALDFRYENGLTEWLHSLDLLVEQCGGRIYLAKDSLLKAATFYKMYPQARHYQTYLQSNHPNGSQTLLGKRLNLVRNMKQQVLIIGANSEVGISCANRYKQLGYDVVLAGHKTDELPAEFPQIQLDLRAVDLTVLHDVDPEIVLFTAGKLGDNDQSIAGDQLAELIDVNFTANAKIAAHFAQQFNQKGRGVLVGVSSVAAVRGKGSTVVYGAAKAGWDSYLAGMRNYLHGTGVRVLTIRPGYIRTKMTAHMTLPERLTASPEQVAAVIVSHSIKGKRSIVYVKPIWRLIAFILKHIPEPIFKTMKW